jgi:FkbM family methyltransferase
VNVPALPCREFEADVSHEGRLDAYLEESVETAQRREQSAFDELAAPYERSLVLFGAGGLGKRTLAGLRRVGIEPRAFCDNTPGLWGRQVEGVPVYSLQDAAERFRANCAFLITIWNGQGKDRMADRARQLTSLGCEKVIPAGFLFWKYPHAFLPYYPLDLPHKLLLRAEHARAGFYRWEDETSRREYVAQIAFRLFLDYDALGSPAEPPRYFPTGLFHLTSRETLIDCGAFDGDTIVSFVEERGSAFDRILAFEPDPLNWPKLQERLAALPADIRSKVTAFRYAVGASTGTVRFNATGTDLSAIGSGTLSVDCVKLDQVLAAEAPTLMKFDIEGAELAALTGGRDVIRRHRPLLAVSAYHQQSHLWDIPAAIQSISEGYRYLLRPQGVEGWDLVCYAVPSGRLVEGGTA